MGVILPDAIVRVGEVVVSLMMLEIQAIMKSVVATIIMIRGIVRIMRKNQVLLDLPTVVDYMIVTML